MEHIYSYCDMNTEKMENLLSHLQFTIAPTI